MYFQAAHCSLRLPYDYGSFLFYFLVVSCKLKSIFAPSEMYFLNLFLFYVHL